MKVCDVIFSFQAANVRCFFSIFEASSDLEAKSICWVRLSMSFSTSLKILQNMYPTSNQSLRSCGCLSLKKTCMMEAQRRQEARWKLTKTVMSVESKLFLLIWFLLFLSDINLALFFGQHSMWMLQKARGWVWCCVRFYGQALAVPSLSAAAHARAMEMAFGRREEVRRATKIHKNSAIRNQDVFVDLFWELQTQYWKVHIFFRKCVVLEVICSFNIRRIRWDFPWKLSVAGSTTCTVHPLGLSIRVTVAADHGCLARSQGGSFCLVKKLPSYGVEVLLVAVSISSGWKVSILKWTGIVSSGRCIANQGRILISYVSTLKQENWRLFDTKKKKAGNVET